MIYISLVGLQPLDVLNPLWLLLKKDKALSHVVLLCTCEFRKTAETVSDHLYRKNNFSRESTIIQNISISLKKTSNDEKPVQEIFKEILSYYHCEDIVFNLAGGLRFQIAACIFRMSDDDFARTRFYCPESGGILETKIDFIRFICQTVYHPLPDIKLDVLKLHKIPYKHYNPDPKRERRIFEAIGSCSASKYIAPPDFIYRNVRINDIQFDRIWIIGKELHFITTIQEQGKNETNAAYGKKIRLMMKHLLHFARTGYGLGGLFHIKIHLLLKDNSIINQLRRYSAGIDAVTPENISTLFLSTRHADMNKDDLPDFSKLADNDESEAAGRNVLLTVSSEEAVCTLITLWNHNAQSVHIFNSPKLRDISLNPDHITKILPMLPCNSVNFHSISNIGSEIMRFPDIKNASVNISSGSRTHLLFLTLWAKKYGKKVYFISNTDKSIIEISSSYKFKLTTPPVSVAYQISEKRLYNIFELENDWQSADRFEAILECIRMFHEKKIDINKFPKAGGTVYKVNLEDRVVRVKKNHAVVTFLKNNKTIRWPIDNNFWLEILLGYVLKKVGAIEAASRVPFTYEVTSLKRKKNKSVRNVLTDIDVVARYNNRYYIISCKSGRHVSPDMEGKIINSNAMLIDRSAIPLLCVFTYKGNPEKLPCGVYKFGYETLIDENKMKNLLSISANAVSKTYEGFKKIVINKLNMTSCLTSFILDGERWLPVEIVGHEKAAKELKENLSDPDVICIGCAESADAGLSNYNSFADINGGRYEGMRSCGLSGDKIAQIKRLAEYALAVDAGNLTTNGISYPSLSDVFSEMMSVHNDDPETILDKGIGIFRTVLEKNIDPRKSVPCLEEWNPYIKITNKKITKPLIKTKKVIILKNYSEVQIGFWKPLLAVVFSFLLLIAINLG